MRMAREPNIIVLDARSRETFDKLHVKRAFHLAFSDIAGQGLLCLALVSTQKMP